MTNMVVVPTQIVSFETYIEAKTANPGKAAMEFAKAKLKKSIAAWQTAIPRIRYDADSVAEHKEWIIEAQDQIETIESWLKNPLPLQEFMRQVQAFDSAYRTRLYAQIFEHAPLLN